MRTLLKSPRGGFSLIELMVAAAVTLIIITAALAVLHRLAAFQRRQVWVELMRRSTSQALAQLAADVRRAGLGCPSSTRLPPETRIPFPPAILQAAPNRLVLLADVPRPDSDFNGLSTLASDQGTLSATGRDWVVIVNEQSGNCVTNLGGSPRCTTSQASLLFRGDSQHCGLSRSARSCPWGLRRYLPNEPLIISNGEGKWLQTRVHGSSVSVDQENRAALQLANAVITDQIMNGITPGFVSTPDRIFYELREAGDALTGTRHLQLVRTQCWNALPLSSPLDMDALDDVDCINTGEGTGPEVVLELDVPPTGSWEASLQFTYHRADGTQLTLDASSPSSSAYEAQLRNIRQVRVNVRGWRQPPGADGASQAFIEYTTQLTIDLRN